MHGTWASIISAEKGQEDEYGNMKDVRTATASDLRRALASMSWRSTTIMSVAGLWVG